MARMSIRAPLLGLSVDVVTTAEAVEMIRGIWRRSAKCRVFFVDAFGFNAAAASPEYCDALNEAEFLLPGGAGVLLAAKLLHLPIQNNLNGADLTPRLCKAAARDGRSVFLLGARPGVAEKAAAALRKRFPRLRIAGVRDGSFQSEESAAVIAEINAAQPDILLVALGVPTQELWITEHFVELDVPVCLAVGALLDFLADAVPQSPVLLRKLRIEWLYMLYREPRRVWKHHLLGNATFLRRAFAVRLGRLPKTGRRESRTQPIPASGMLLAAPRSAFAPAPYAELPIPQRGNMRWSAAPTMSSPVASGVRSRVTEAQRERSGAPERVPMRFP